MTMDGQETFARSSLAQRRVSRRTVLRLAAFAVASVPLGAACGQQPPAAATQPPAKAAATQAPAKPAAESKPAEAKPAAVTKTDPVAKGQPAPAAPAQPGSALVGKLEGPTVITDAAQFPTAFKEAPELAALVQQGKLPPVQERIGQDPLVVKPLHEIGKYGGTWRRGFTGPADWSNGLRAVQHDKLLYFDYTGAKLVPHIARGWEVSQDGKVTTVLLRRGMKWSDGQPFTADDFLFWFEDIYQYKDLGIASLGTMFVKGQPVVLEKVDEATVRFVSPEPYFGLPDVLAGVLGIGHHARFGRDGHGGFAPAHYLKQFHPKYASKEELDSKVAAAGADNWATLFKLMNDSARNPDLPVVTAWKTATPITTPTWTFERNPYSVWIDTDGNQLPYIDRVQMTLAENLEVLNLRAISGEYDEQARHIDLGKLPVFIENQQKGNYKVYLDPSAQGSDMGLYLNQSYEADPEIAKWLTNREFRIALSHGIERAQINETFALGLGVVGSAAPDENTPYSPGPEFRQLHSTYDVQKANQILDGLGLTQKDPEGYRLRTDGQGPIRLEVVTYLGFLQFTQIAEMIREHWRRIGIRAEVAELERSLSIRRKDANEAQIYVDTQWGGDNMFGHFPQFFPFAANNPLGPLYGAWYSSAGARGKEPPPRMKELMEKYRQGFSVPESERVQLAQDVWKIALDEVWTINVIANSPANQGVRIVRNNVGNTPERQWNSAAADNPAPAHPETYFFQS